MFGLVDDLCRTFTGSQCALPRWSEWSLVDPSQADYGLDIADLAGGAGVVAPVNLMAYKGYFCTGLVNDLGTKAVISGSGLGAGVGAGWGIPFVGGRAVGKIPNSIARQIAERASGAAQDVIIDMLLEASKLSISGGTRLVYGPDAPSGGMSPLDFRGFATVVSLGVDFGPNGVAGSLVMFSRSRPVLQMFDFIHVTAVGVMGSVGIAASIDVEVNGMVYTIDLN